MSGEAGFKYACSKSQGALLYLDNAADREAVYTNEVWVKYIRTNYPSWIKILESVGLNDEIIVVRGWIKASAWAVAAWCDKSTEHQVTLSGSGGIAQAGFSFTSSDESNNSVEKRTGPDPPGDAITESGGSLPKDQTIFMSYYKIVDRFFFFSIKAKAGSHNLPRGDGGDSGNDPFYIDNEGIEVSYRPGVPQNLGIISRLDYQDLRSP